MLREDRSENLVLAGRLGDQSEVEKGTGDSVPFFIRLEGECEEEKGTGSAPPFFFSV